MSRDPNPATFLEFASLGDILEILRRRKFLIGVITLLGVVAGLLVALALPDLYTTQAKIVLERDDTRVSDASSEIERISYNRSTIETEVDIIQSREFLKRLVKDLKLGPTPSFQPSYSPPSPLRIWLLHLGLPAHSGGWQDVFADFPYFNSRGNDEEVSAEAKEEQATTVLKFCLKVTRQGESLSLQLAVTHPDREIAAEITNAIAKAYIDLSLERQRTAVNRAIIFLRKRASDLARNISELER